MCTYVFTPDSVRPPDLSDKLCSIEADLDDVVEQSKSWSQREGGHEQRHEPVLDDWKKEHINTGTSGNTTLKKLS